MLARGRKTDDEPHRLLVEREKFAPHVMMSSRVCIGRKGHLYFVYEKTKVNIA